MYRKKREEEEKGGRKKGGKGREKNIECEMV